MEYTKGCNTPVKNACKSTNMLQLLKFSICFYQIFHEYRTYRSHKSYFFCFWNCYFLAGKLRHKRGAKKLEISYW
jgi:hypothetical protein